MGVKNKVHWGYVTDETWGPENVEMSLYGADFLRNASRLLQVDGLDPPDMRFQPHGYLFLASEEGAEIMQENNRVQVEGNNFFLFLTFIQKGRANSRCLTEKYPSRNFCRMVQ